MDVDIARIFANEARRRMDRVGTLVANGIPPPRTPERDELWRHLHSLKGTAASLGFEEIGALSERLALTIAPEGAPSLRDVPPEETAAILGAVDALENAVSALGDH